MSNKKIPLVVLIAFIVIGGMVLNFPEFLMGSPANLKNIIVTATYLAAWSFIVSSAKRTGDRGLLKASSVFWALTLGVALVTAYANVTSAQVDWAIPFALVLMGQWYGLNILAGSFLITSVIIALISLVMVAISALSPRKQIVS